MSIPNANSPGLLTRMLESVGRGVRSTRGLQEVLGVRGRTVNYYARAGEWLGFLESEQLALTRLGLEYVYEVEARGALYAEGVWKNPVARALLEVQPGAFPPVEVVAEVIAKAEPDLAPSTVRRRASAVRSLLAPAVGARPAALAPAQLRLPLTAAPPPSPKPKRPLAAREYDPEVYRAVLLGLMDYGELNLGALRALLDRTGVPDLPLGSYVEMALSRGDAERIGERLVITPTALRDREAAESGLAVMLSDPGFGRYLVDREEAAAGSAVAASRRDTARPAYAQWVKRISDGSNVKNREWLDTPAPVAAPFLAVWERSDLLLSAPPYLASLTGGLMAVNQAIAAARRQVRGQLPDLGEVPSVVHGGLFHPGESVERPIPDIRSLRSQLLTRSPYTAIIAAFLWLARRRPEAHALTRHRGAWWVTRGERRHSLLFPLIERFASARGWSTTRHPRHGLSDSALLDGLEAVGIVHLTARRALLAEPLFGALIEEIDESEVYDSLSELVEALEGWLESEAMPKRRY